MKGKLDDLVLALNGLSREEQERLRALLRGINVQQNAPKASWPTLLNKPTTVDGFGITDAAREYLAPLIMGEAYPEYRDGLPVYVRLKNLAVPRKLKTRFKL